MKLKRSKLGTYFASLLLGAALLSAGANRASAWRSALYPTHWQPGFQDLNGNFLHDFSYAGYHNTEIAIPVVTSLPTFNVATQYGADGTGATDATAAIQAAIDDAKTTGGGIVYVPPGLYRCDGQLLVTGDHTILRGAGPGASRLYFTLCAPSVTYDGHIKFQGNVQWGADVPLAVDGVNQKDYVDVNDASSLSVGQEIAVGWVITPAFIAQHGMTGTWVSFTNQWKPFFRRVIKNIDTLASPPRVYLDVPLRYPALLRDAASIRPVVHGPTVHGYLTESGVEDLGLCNAGDPACADSYNQIQLLLFRDSEDCWVRDVQSFASPNPLAAGYHVQSGGIDLENCNRMTVVNCIMQFAQNRGSGGNGYLFQVSRSNEILTRECYAVAGRHNFIQNWDFGTTGCVWLRCRSRLGAYKSEYHHSLSMACLVDSCLIEDGWQGGNRGADSSGAGHTVTQSVWWNSTGTGFLGSWNYAMGYVIGSAPGLTVWTTTWLLGESVGTEPWDYTEGLGLASTLTPQSLFEDQLHERTTNGVGRDEWRVYE